MAFYTDYINHMLSYYVKNYPVEPEHKTLVDRVNWQAANTCVQRLSKVDQATIFSIYSLPDTIADNIYAISRANGIDQRKIWQMLGQLCDNIAKVRGLK